MGEEVCLDDIHPSTSPVATSIGNIGTHNYRGGAIQGNTGTTFMVADSNFISNVAMNGGGIDTDSSSL